MTMDFRLSDDSDVLRDEARRFLDEHFTDDVRGQMHATGVHHDRDFHQARVARGMLAPGWPEEYGGQGRDPLEVLAMAEEFQTAGAPTYGGSTTLMVANVIRHIGTEEQKRMILPQALGGRSSSCSASPSPNRDRTSQRRRPVPCAMATTG